MTYLQGYDTYYDFVRKGTCCRAPTGLDFAGGQIRVEVFVDLRYVECSLFLCVMHTDQGYETLVWLLNTMYHPDT